MLNVCSLLPLHFSATTRLPCLLEKQMLLSEKGVSWSVSVPLRTGNSCLVSVRVSISLLATYISYV